MAVSLTKGANVSLSQEAPGLSNVLLGLGWDERASTGDEFDLDACVFLVAEDGKVRSDNDFIFYGKLESDCGSVAHAGDNRTGQGDGDDETVKVHLNKVPADVNKIVVTVTIDKGDERNQNFGQIENAFMRVVNIDGEIEIARFDLTEDYSVETAMIFGEIYKHNEEWKFKAVGQGFQGGLSTLCNNFGISVMS